MSEFDNTNRFTLWGNKDKTEANPTWADFQGEINIDGKEYFLSAWKRKPDGNPKAPPLSGSVKLKEKQSNQQAPASQTSAVPADDEFDNIPF